MTASLQKTSQQSDASPIEWLQSNFQEDMKGVNAHILDYLQSDVPLIPELANYLIASGGKRIRPLLVLSSTQLLGGDMERAHRLAAAVEFIHSATLLHDDVVDNSDQRRGKKTAHVIFGNEASVLVGDFLFSRSFQLMVADGSIDVLKVLSDASSIITEGEVNQLSNQQNVGITFEQYFKVIEGKTASLFAASCEVGAIIANSSDKARQAIKDYGYHIGISFQICDDTLDYDTDRSRLGKDIGDDFYEGKMTAPLLFAIQSSNEDEKSFWQDVLSKETRDEKDLEQAIALIRKYKSIEECHTLAKTHVDKAVNCINQIAEESELKNALIGLAAFTMERTK
ncbi:MAG: polyprenyl synthetase family protein [Pseudomonadota bacterium]